jgi:hypothetical protein
MLPLRRLHISLLTHFVCWKSSISSDIIDGEGKKVESLVTKLGVEDRGYVIKVFTPLHCRLPSTLILSMVMDCVCMEE